jgi:hypothetical protein
MQAIGRDAIEAGVEAEVSEKAGGARLGAIGQAID